MKLLLKELRKQKGMTQEELAKGVGHSKRVVGAWERFETQISLDDACRVCDALGCTPNDLCGWYLDHPEDLPAPPGGANAFADPYQAELNACYEASNAEGRTVILGTARGQRELSKKVSERPMAGSEVTMAEAM